MAVTGFGWIEEQVYGLGDEIQQVEGSALREVRNEQHGFVRYPIKNFRRFSLPARYACCAVALALKDAGVAYGEQQRLAAGVIGFGQEGALEANKGYYTDYVDNGRTLGRGNLFIYTLPSSPLAEVAIHFGMEGPLQYMMPVGDSLLELVEAATLQVELRQAEQMALIGYDSAGAVCALLDGAVESTLSDLEQAGRIAHIRRLLCRKSDSPDEK